jgi:flagellar motor switch/type III secretory pathway protein FliN
MSELRIRSEAIPDAVWPEMFVPMPARNDRWDDALDESDFGPFVVEVGRALGLLFGRPVEVTPGRPPKPERDEVVPRIAPALAAALATLAMGGDLSRTVQATGDARSRSSLALARQARQLAQIVDGVADRMWPAGSRVPGFDLDVACGAVAGHVHVPAPASARVAPAPPSASPVLAARVFELPMRVRVELASAMTAVSALLPLRRGTVLPIDPVPEMPLLMGDHRIGHVTLAPLPDGRQQAVITAIRVEPYGGMA